MGPNSAAHLVLSLVQQSEVKVLVQSWTTSQGDPGQGMASLQASAAPCIWPAESLPKGLIFCETAVEGAELVGFQASWPPLPYGLSV